MNEDGNGSVRLALSVLALLAFVYLWMITGGSLTHWTHSNTLYSQLTTTFLHGRLSLDVQPAPQLLALPNPYDPIANAPYRQVYDASLYNGKYYYYWGPVPALLAAAVCKAAGIRNPVFGDEQIGLAFLCGATVLLAALLFDVRARCFSELSARAAATPIFSMALGAAVLSNLSWLGIYEAAILAGQFFLLAGLCAAWWALRDGRTRYGLLATAGACWALSAGSRVSLPPAVAALALLTLLFIRHGDAGQGRRRTILASAAMILPLAAGGSLLAWYNHARFGSIFETGVRLQLGAQDQSDPLRSGFISWRNVVPNLLVYLFNPPAISRAFPYLLASKGKTWVSTLIQLPAGYNGETLTGLLWTQPFLILGLPAMMKSRRRTSAGPPSADRLPEIWLMRASLLGALLAAAPLLLIGYSAVRYLVDAIPLLTIAAAIGYWRILESLRGRPRAFRDFRGAVCAVVALQCVAGVLLGISQSLSSFHRVAPWFPFL